MAPISTHRRRSEYPRRSCPHKVATRGPHLTESEAATLERLLAQEERALESFPIDVHTRELGLYKLRREYGAAS